MLEEIGKRLDELIPLGHSWGGCFARGNTYYVANEAHGWLTAAGNLVQLVTNGRGRYSEQAGAILDHPDLHGGVPAQCVIKMTSLLEMLLIDWQRGLVREIEYLVSAENFDAFLDHADGYHRGGKKQEAGVLVSAVFEDAVRKLAKKHSIDFNAEIEHIIAGLVGASAFKPVFGRTLKATAALRNKALHAKWDEFELEDVGSAISTTRELLKAL